MSLENYFKALRLRKEALDIRDEVIELLTKNEEREINRDEQFRSLLGRYNREVGVLKAKVKDLEAVLKEAEDYMQTEEYIEDKGDNTDKDLSEEEKKRLRVLASQAFNDESPEVV